MSLIDQKSQADFNICQNYQNEQKWFKNETKWSKLSKRIKMS